MVRNIDGQAGDIPFFLGPGEATYLDLYPIAMKRLSVPMNGTNPILAVCIQSYSGSVRTRFSSLPKYNGDALLGLDQPTTYCWLLLDSGHY